MSETKVILIGFLLLTTILVSVSIGVGMVEKSSTELACHKQILATYAVQPVDYLQNTISKVTENNLFIVDKDFNLVCQSKNLNLPANLLTYSEDEVKAVDLPIDLYNNIKTNVCVSEELVGKLYIQTSSYNFVAVKITQNYTLVLITLNSISNYRHIIAYALSSLLCCFLIYTAVTLIYVSVLRDIMNVMYYEFTENLKPLKLVFLPTNIEEETMPTRVSKVAIAYNVWITEVRNVIVTIKDLFKTYQKFDIVTASSEVTLRLKELLEESKEKTLDTVELKKSLNNLNINVKATDDLLTQIENTLRKIHT